MTRTVYPQQTPQRDDLNARDIVHLHHGRARRVVVGRHYSCLTRLVESFVEGGEKNAALYYGRFATAWAMMQFIFHHLHALSNRFGRRPVLLLSCLGLGLDSF